MLRNSSDRLPCYRSILIYAARAFPFLRRKISSAQKDACAEKSYPHKKRLRGKILSAEKYCLREKIPPTQKNPVRVKKSCTHRKCAGMVPRRILLLPLKFCIGSPSVVLRPGYVLCRRLIATARTCHAAV
ncbi:hypothetical protein BRYFOR_07460 [Marvinbryantia formatexigens DSM 14469]|uniref:Uncharacterized protein n=1 Tax=Marvinbryantia formatexigens DSM 14469 TaxID=478749 RepID=C6LFQ0_9FIRM|nr:hypothetical protein BRYFOR_07460 [Marvinbryantia formatexigens DSM 14469]